MGKIRIPFDVFCQKAVSNESFFTDAPSEENGIDMKLIKKALAYVINQELSPKQRHMSLCIIAKISIWKKLRNAVVFQNQPYQELFRGQEKILPTE